MTTSADETSALHKNINGATEDGELVTEFPPPPFYYTQVSSLTPPPIPHEAIQRASLKALEQLKKKKEEAEKTRLASVGLVGVDGVGMEGGGNNEEFLGGDAPDFEKSVGENEKDEEVAVFGEYVEVRLGYFLIYYSY